MSFISKFIQVIYRQTAVYIKIYKDAIEITNLDSGETIFRDAMEKFSTNRIPMAKFQPADELTRSIIKDLVKKGATLKVLIQQMVSTEDGIADIEKRALRDLGEMAGASSVKVLDHDRKLSIQEALLELAAP